MPLNDFPGKHNWGYDGVLPYAPDSAYGRPEELKALIDAAHGLGLMVFLDVVYNHFGPDGNYLHEYARSFFREGTHTPWGPAIDFERSEVSDFFTTTPSTGSTNIARRSAFRRGACHRQSNVAARIVRPYPRKVQHGRHVHLVLENEHNSASLLETHFDAQWNDDAHNTLHVLLTAKRKAITTRIRSADPRLARVLSKASRIRATRRRFTTARRAAKRAGICRPLRS
jgi:1,4-alpha-glucan branching enzyme